MRDRTRDRVLLPIAMPLGILLLLVAVLFGFSRILLSLAHAAATATAIVVAVAILAVSAIAAGRSVIRPSSLAAVGGVVAGVAMLAGGVALIAVSPAAEGGARPPGAPALTVTASGLKFDTSTIDLAADAPTTIRFENKDDGVQHNIAIYQDESLQKLLFRGDIVTGPGSADYRVPGLPAGTYFFHCDVHPTMNGKVVVAEGGVEGGGGAGGGAAVEPSTVVASGLAFNTDSMTIRATTPSVLEFDNQDAGTSHNIAIYPSESQIAPEQALFQGQIVTGPARVTYHIPPLDAGSYYFHCDVHPTMNGTVTVK